MHRLLDAKYNARLLQNVRVDEALMALFDVPTVPYPYDKSFWILNYSALGSAALYENRITNFEQALTTLAWAGDIVEKEGGGRAQSYLRQMVSAEVGGRFWWDARNGEFRFQNRHWDARQTTIANFDSTSFTGVPAAFGDDVANVITVDYEPRSLGTPASVLWTAESFTLPAGESRDLTARYNDPDNPDARVAATDIIQPVRGTDYAATVNGVDATSDLTVSVEVSASSSKITVLNNSLYEATITLLRLRGTPLTTYKRQQAEALDAASIAAYDRKPKPLNLPALNSTDFADGVARYTLAKFKDAFSRWKSAQFIANDSEALRNAALDRTIGDKVRLSDGYSGHDSVYIIVGERHAVNAAEGKHETTWTLKPTERERFWKLQDAIDGELNGDNVIAL
jgi:hypothetical protein